MTMEMMPGNNYIENPKLPTLEDVKKMIEVRTQHLAFIEKKLAELGGQKNSPEQTESLQKMKATTNERLEALKKQKVELENKKVEEDYKLAA